MDGNIDEEIDLFEVAQRIWKRKKFIFTITIAGTILVGIISFFMTPYYKATTVIIPIQKQKSTIIPLSSEILSLLGQGFSLDQPSIIVAVLNSRELAKEVISSLLLQKYLYEKMWDDKKGNWREDIPSHKIPTLDEMAEEFIKENLKIEEDKKKGIISISVIFPKSPTLASLIANEYVKHLEKMLIFRAYTNARKYREFVEKRLEIAKEELAKAEEMFSDFQRKYNIISIDAQTESSIKIYAEVFAKLTEKESKLEVLRKLTSPGNPEVLALQYEVEELKQKLKELEGDTNPRGYIMRRGTKGGAILNLAEVPDIGIQYIRVRRDFEVKNEVYKMLVRSYEQAKLEEAKEDVSFQVVDYAYPPKYKFKPRRKVMVLVAFSSFLMLSIFLSLFMDALEQRKKRL